MISEAKVGVLPLWEGGGAVSQGYGELLEAEKSSGNFRRNSLSSTLILAP